MRHLGIDYGTKRVGIAVSDIKGKIAFPKLVLDNDENLLQAIGDIVNQYEVSVIVVGRSLDNSSKPNAVQSAIDDLVTDLTLQFGLPVHMETEHYTTQAAVRIQGRNKQTDASAASLILDSFLQRNN